MCKKNKCGMFMLFVAAAALILWLVYQRMSQSKELAHDGSTLVRDMKSVYADSKCVCKDARQMGRDVIDETMQMKEDLTREVKDVKDQLCGCEKGNAQS